jgi:hypothetical protein
MLHPKRENWQKRLLQAEAEARERADQKKVDALEAVKESHLRALRMVLGKGIEALKHVPIVRECIRRSSWHQKETEIRAETLTFTHGSGRARG